MQNKGLIFFREIHEKNQENHIKTIFILLPLPDENLNLKSNSNEEYFDNWLYRSDRLGADHEVKKYLW